VKKAAKTFAGHEKCFPRKISDVTARKNISNEQGLAESSVAGVFI
jgi:hypothetical protein